MICEVVVGFSFEEYVGDVIVFCFGKLCGDEGVGVIDFWVGL